MNENDLVGKAVVSMADGAKVGVVNDLIFKGVSLQGLSLKGDKGNGILAFKNIGTTGPDAISIESYKNVDWDAGKTLEPDSHNLHDLRKLKVIDDSGTELGHLHAVTLDNLGNIEEIAVRTEGVFGIGSHQALIAGARIRSLGPTLITVEADPNRVAT
jgi:sporulation protein YlmC with PRC-barrel domain